MTIHSLLRHRRHHPRSLGMRSAAMKRTTWYVYSLQLILLNCGSVLTRSIVNDWLTLITRSIEIISQHLQWLAVTVISFSSAWDTVDRSLHYFNGSARSRHLSNTFCRVVDGYVLETRIPWMDTLHCQSWIPLTLSNPNRRILIAHLWSLSVQI